MTFIYVSVVSALLALAIGKENQDNAVLDVQAKLLEWEAPAELHAKFPYYLSGYDYDGRPVLVMEWGKWDSRSIVEKGGRELGIIDKMADQFIERVRTGYFHQYNNQSDFEAGDDEIVIVLDFDGMQLDQVKSPANLKFLIKRGEKLEKIYDYFAYGFILHANPVVDQVINLSKPYMGKFLERMEIYGTIPKHWIPRLLKKIPRDQLHPAYGGTEDFRPIAIYEIQPVEANKNDYDGNY